MSFLKISDPVKRDLIVKEYLEIKKNIRDNLLSERTGEQQLQTDLSKFYRPITETQKATAREITEGLRPIREGIENLPQAIKFPPIQLLGEASGKALEKEEPYDLGEIADKYLNKTPGRSHDETFGMRKIEGLYYIGNKQATICNPFPNNPWFFTCLLYKYFENTVGKGEIAHNEQFLLFPQCFLSIWRTFCHFYKI